MSLRYSLSAEVYRELRQKNLTADEVLREALNIHREGFVTSDGKYFPEGTTLIALYKGRALSAVVKAGALETDSKSFSSLSAAAAHYTGRPTTNGWDFWCVRIPGKNSFIPANEAAQKRAA